MAQHRLGHHQEAYTNVRQQSLFDRLPVPAPVLDLHIPNPTAPGYVGTYTPPGRYDPISIMLNALELQDALAPMRRWRRHKIPQAYLQAQNGLAMVQCGPVGAFVKCTSGSFKGELEFPGEALMLLAKGAAGYVVFIDYYRGTLKVGGVKVAAKLDHNACPRFMADAPADRQRKLLF